MGPEKNCWGARAVKVLTVSSVQESLQTLPIVLPKMSSKRPQIMKRRRCMEIWVPTEGLAKIGGYSPTQAPAGAIPE